MGAALTILGTQAVSPLALAWRQSGVHWSQAISAFARHLLPILACAAVPAVERCFVLLRGTRFSRGSLALLDLVVTLWRVLLCAVTVWAACSGRELHGLTAQMGAMAAWQVALEHVGVILAHRIRAILWELLFFTFALLLAEQIVRWLVQACSRSVAWLHEAVHRKAVLSVWRNLILLPLALLYLVEMIRPSLR